CHAIVVIPTTAFLRLVRRHAYDPETLLIGLSIARNLPNWVAQLAVPSFDGYGSRVQSSSALAIYPQYFHSDDFGLHRSATIIAKRRWHTSLTLFPNGLLSLVAIAPNDNHFSGCSGSVRLASGNYTNADIFQLA